MAVPLKGLGALKLDHQPRSIMRPTGRPTGRAHQRPPAYRQLITRSTENATVARHLLADLVGRGLGADDGLLVVIDGAKALSSAVRDVFGARAAIQRCTVHKRRNVAEHLPESERDWVDLKLVRALNNPDEAAGIRDAKALATTLGRKHPGAAGSLREGLPDLFTVALDASARSWWRRRDQR